MASALADSADQLIVTRAVMGIGGALIMPATLSNPAGELEASPDHHGGVPVPVASGPAEPA